VSDVDSDLLPILGERLAIDVANSWYVHTDGVRDHLSHPELAVAYLGRLSWPDGTRPPSRLASADHQALLGARTIVRQVLDAAVDATVPPRRVVSDLNELARQAPLVVSLAWTAGGGATRGRAVTSVGIGHLLGLVAVDTIELLTAEPATPIRRCAHPTCSMLFCQDHHLRRFCSPGCSHRDRQHRYAATRSTQQPAGDLEP
jgi:predicted RNA-binding Zn ribbon-like protein